MAWLLGAGAGASGTAAAAGAGTAASTAAGLGTAGGLGIGGAAATPALSLAGSGATLGSTIPAIGAGSSGLTGALGGAATPGAVLGSGISTAGGIAPQLTSGAVSAPSWYTRLFDSAENYVKSQYGDASKAGGGDAPKTATYGGFNNKTQYGGAQPAQESPLTPAQLYPKRPYSPNHREDIAALLESIFNR